MKNISIPETAAGYQAELLEQAFPDTRIIGNDFYRRMVGWVIDNRTPLTYEQTHPDEYTNLSINFNWLLMRDYSQTELGEPDTVQALYALHEFAHMTHWLPTRLDDVSASEYAEQFTTSEYRASNESEILVHYRVPELRASVFPGMKLAVDIMKNRGLPQPSSLLLDQLRAVVVEHDALDYLVGTDPEARAEIARVKQFGGNREWSAQHYQNIRHRFTDPSLPLGHGLTEAEYEPTISAYEPHLTQAMYEANIVRNVRFAYAMCGHGIPLITSFGQAREMAADLEGQHALV